MAADAQVPETSVKETLTSIMISFIVALVFRGFVIEGFQIPTGSMGPTLLGAHVDVHSDISGYDWPVEPWTMIPRSSTPTSDQPGMSPTDPMTGIELPAEDYTKRSGDRVFVFKYLEPFYRPARWDVTVFKVPTRTQENYIKRMIGIPGDQLAFVDGDVFVHRGSPAPVGWDAPGWQIQRKPVRVQRAVWQTVFDATYAPIGITAFRSPWASDSPAWSGLDGGPTYTYSDAAPTSLTWVNRVQRLDDYHSYNEIPGMGEDWDRDQGIEIYPVPDVAVSFGFEPGADTATVSAVLGVGDCSFRATLVRDGSTATAVVGMRESADAPWHQLDIATLEDNTLAAGRVTNFEFWHVDQAIWLFADGRLVAGGPVDGAYDWQVARRLGETLGEEPAARVIADNEGAVHLDVPGLYPVPTLRCDFAGSAFKIHRVRVARDLFYRPVHFRSPDWNSDPRTAPGRPGLGTHPSNPILLGPDEFFMCGDNSARSLDSRVWGGPHPAVEALYHSQPGAVHRNLLIGKAFIVYFPGPHSIGRLPIPDFGHIRWIW